ncbi:MAG: ABC transporter ATP-binding protein [bacterium]
MISIRNLTKKYDSLTAVEDLSLDIRPGEVFGFLGPNGAGKTTTIKMICGLLLPTSGTVSICGYDVVRQPMQAKSRIGLVPDTPVIYKKLTGREFVRFVGELYGVDSAIIDRRCNEIFEIFELNNSADQLIETYSHGMKQKVMITAALVHDPDVLVLDEPTVGLDPRSAKVIKDLLRGLSKNGKTVFMSTHILEIAERVCDRVGIINKGKLIAIGSIDDLKSKSKHGLVSLEDIFLELTGGPEESELIKFLST